MSVQKVALGFPWYNGPDVDTFIDYFEQLFYFGRMRERGLIVDELEKAGVSPAALTLPPLDFKELDPRGELLNSEERFEFFLAKETRMSLTGLARERLVEMALAGGMDWLFCWDADMRFPLSTFLRLWRHQKPVVGALAFTSREPVQPCVYVIKERRSPETQEPMWGSDTVFDFPDDSLISNEHVGGEIAFGAGVSLYNMNIFRQIPRPWFHSTGCGEDWFFCFRASRFGVPRYVDTSFNIQHKEWQPRWVDKSRYFQDREKLPDVYEKLMRKGELALL